MSDENVTLPDEPDQPTEVHEPVDGEVAAAETAPEPPPSPTCPECGTELDEDQAYCLECGAPTPAAPKLRRRIGPAGVLALGLLALGGGAGALAYAIAKDDEGTAQATTGISLPTDQTFPSIGTETTTPTDITGTGPGLTLSTETVPPFPSTSTTSPTTSTSIPGTDSTNTGDDTNTIDPVDPGTTDGTTTDDPPVTDPPPTTPTDPPQTGGADTWPNGRDGWTVILASTSDQAAATRFRDQVKNSGRAGVGLIDSSLYSTLQPDLWVVYAGVLSRTEAINSAKSLRSTYPEAYAQRITEA